MLKKFNKHIKNEKGLTLIELLAVIVILAIIAAIAVPAIGNIIQKTKEKSVYADALLALSAAELYFVDNQAAPGPATLTDLVPGYLDTNGSLESVSVTKPTATTGSIITYKSNTASGVTINVTTAETKAQVAAKAKNGTPK